MNIELRGQVALVTGSAHRVGKAIALALAQAGVHIMVHYNRSSPEVAAATLDAIREHGVEAHALQADISQPEGVDQLFGAVRQHFGRLNILVNSASNFQKRGLMDVTLAEWEETMRINVTAPFLCTQAAARMMRENDPPGGSIINISDYGGLNPWPEFAHHGISKAALYMLSRVSALALGPDNIRVNTLVPGMVLKPEDYDADAWQRTAEQQVPLKRPGTAEDVARAVVYLCSEDWLSGVTLRIDGGDYP